MAIRDNPRARGERRSQYLRGRMAAELVEARHAAGLSAREVARVVGVSAARIDRLEHADPASMTVDLVARTAAALGLDLAASLHPNGDPARDRGQLALLARFRARIPAVMWRVEVPIPIAGDLRSADAVVAIKPGDVLIEAETHVNDVQLVERRSSAKCRDLGALRVVLVLADTRHHWRLLHEHPELRQRFPVGTRGVIAALKAGRDPGGDGLVVL
jgi:transcriptional regulator with XRE-family HTH domain